jgi:hypothetical protein
MELKEINRKNLISKVGEASIPPRTESADEVVHHVLAVFGPAAIVVARTERALRVESCHTTMQTRMSGSTF